MKTVFFTIVDDEYYYNVGTHLFVNSFKKFHPDIDLVVYRQDMIDKVMKDGINFYNAKPTFAKLLTDKYDKVVNIDADTIITGRLEPVLEDNYDVGAVWNYNRYENASLEDITEKMYVQAGLVASTDKKFWDVWEEANKDAMKYLRKENDTLNLIWYGHRHVKSLKRVIFDEEKYYMGCKSLGQEGLMYLKDDKLMLDDEQVLAYHHAKGKDFPKLNFATMPFTREVILWLQEIGWKGTSVKYAEL